MASHLVWVIASFATLQRSLPKTSLIALLRSLTDGRGTLVLGLIERDKLFQAKQSKAKQSKATAKAWP